MTEIDMTDRNGTRRGAYFGNATRAFLLSVLAATLWAVVVSLLTPPEARAEEAAVLQAVDIAELPGKRIQIRFQLSKPAAEPRSFTVNDPARIVLDFPHTVNGLHTRRQDIGSGIAESLSVLESTDRTRATLNLARLVPFAVRAQGNTVLLTLEASGNATGTLSTVAADKSSPVPAGSQLSNVEFRRGPDGQALIGIALSDASTSISVREEGNQIIADFLGATLPREQERRLDVSDFATPVQLVDALNRGNNARIAVQTTGRYQYLAYQTDTRYTIEVRPILRQQEGGTRTAEQRFVGDALSLNFQDIEVRAVLQIIADFTGLNVVVSDTVQGNVTLRLHEVPWDQALDIVLRTRGLNMRQNGNVVYVAPAEEIKARERLDLESRQQVTELAPLRSELIQVNYARAADLNTLLKSEGVSLLSARGQLAVDERTNNLLIQDVAENITEIRRLVSSLDIPVRQVMIDSRVVIANDTFSRELGVRFGATRGGSTSITGSASGANRLVGSDALTAIPLAERLGVNLGTVSNPFGRLALAILGDDYLLDLELSALQVEGRGEVLSNPRVITTDRTLAIIKQGREIPFQTRTDDSVVTQFRDAVLELAVTPQITPDNRVIMDLRVKKDERGEDVPSGVDGGFLPTIEKREISTQVLVNNGETVVLGGVFEQVSRHDRDKVPFLADLPAVGRLFQRSINRDQKLELLIFVTPKIITEGMPIR